MFYKYRKLSLDLLSFYWIFLFALTGDIADYRDQIIALRYACVLAGYS